MQLVLEHEVGRAAASPDPEERARPLLPCEARKLVDRRNQERWRVPVQRLIDHAARQRCLAPTEVALQARAMELEIIEAGPVASFGVERFFAPRTARKEQAVAGLLVGFTAFAARSNCAHVVGRFFDGIRAHATADPDANAERLFTQSRTGTGVVASD